MMITEPKRTPREILIAARKLIETPDRWTQGAFARNANGVRVGPNNETAVCWCIEGALLKALGKDAESDYSPIEEPLDFLISSTERAWPYFFNDASGRTHAEVLAAFDRAIELAGV